MKLIFATRPSALARRQTALVIAALQRRYPDLNCEEKIITTQGDRVLDRPLPEIGGKGLFTTELEAELLTEAVDCAVHSLKDLPVDDSPDLVIGCIPARADVRDVLISTRGTSLDELIPGSSVGTSSLRRAAQLLAVRPDLRIESIRGNVDTRIRKVMDGQYDAIILAAAGVQRLDMEKYVTEWLSLDVMLPAPGQGALAVQCRADDESTSKLLAAIEDHTTRSAVTAERAFLQGLGGGCAIPVAAHARYDPDTGDTSLTGLVISSDGRGIVRVTAVGTDPVELGMMLARKALAEGAQDILAAVSNKAGG